MLDEKTVRKVAEIARISLTEEEIKKFAKEFEEVEKAFSKLSEVDTSDAEPAFHPFELKNIWREDVPAESWTQELALSNTEHKENGFFKGPKII